MSALDRAQLLALTEIVSPSLNGASAARLARQLDEAGLEATLRGETSPWFVDDDWVPAAIRGVTEERVDFWTGELDALSEDGVKLVVITDDDYPTNLRLIVNRPPLIFVRGSISAVDDRAVAVVGTRDATAEGVQAARQLAGDLARRGITVISGLAAGIDTAAHEGALDANGRTVAVFGTGIRRVYPGANKPLARRVAERGACISQFLPAQTGERWTFPVRNIVTSGLSLGTIVIEASSTSGARRQADEALRHGKRLYLLDRLVMGQEWARALIDQPGVAVVSTVEQLVEDLEYELSVPSMSMLV
ncbi:MAG TPA: DNA processing protein DprA [Actinobacteria bacterium]|nr:DNA processing protein DprA [Actinomycetota bacterium]